ncbi:hypothetical protein [Rhodococcus aetherivorans]|uniref:hypothetical protein n=1 Tax=Rhodococcus aetherivorans TaxID=191292 RepID=UPI0029497266|nr:hypothetical protein [Rhodococcus aetherivorans]MDV6296707.1 hypothetical protein [Rhodococcus aetherivorans]
MKDDYLDNLGRAETDALYARFTDGTLTQDQARAELPKVWDMTAHPGALLTPAQWRDLWQLAGHIRLYRDTHGGDILWEEIPRPSNAIPLYRSADDAFKTNPSWTTNEQLAWDWGYGDTVWVAEFTPERLLATIDIKPSGETEYVAYAEELELRVHRRKTQFEPDPSDDCSDQCRVR